jgi:TRAP-type C4-dicarboxylate transport system permease small subunit
MRLPRSGFPASSSGKPAQGHAGIAGLAEVKLSQAGPLQPDELRRAKVELVQSAARNLKWRALDPLEHALMVLCGICLAGFSASTLLDVGARVLGHPLLWPQEVTSAFFIYGVFVGAAVATRRNDHLYLTAVTEAMSARFRRFFEVFNRLVVLLVGVGLVVFGFQNFLTGFGSFRMPSMLPIAYLFAIIPVSGVLVGLFSIEQMWNGWRNGFEGADERPEPESII